MAVTYSNIAGQEPSTVTFRVGTVQIARGSTNEQQEILVIGDPQTSNALTRVVAAPPSSTEFGLVVRPLIAGAASIATGQVTCDTTVGGVQIVGARATRRSVTVLNLGSTGVYLGTSGVAANTGVFLVGAQGAAITFETTAAVNGFSTGSAVVSYVEEYD